MPSQVLIPAAEYLRMSTDDQPNSIPFQKEAIRRYATEQGFEVIASYADPGRSGIEIKHRPALRQLLKDVVDGHSPFRVILVYDVSRWGRFQDADESAHYEFLCRSSGVPVHYCAEQFENDGGMSNSILKALKRTMAAEYSRELAVKVYAGQRVVAANGYWGGSTAGYGLRRMVVSSDGLRRQILQFHERKNITSDHVILVPGPPEEVECIRTIFALAADKRKSPGMIEKELDRLKIRYIGGQPWKKDTVLRALKNEKYIGSNVWGRITRPFGKYTRAKPRAEWIVKPNAFTPLINSKQFARVQELIAMRNYKINKPDSYFFDGMRKVLRREGRLTEKLLKKEGIFNHRAFVRRFGSIERAYESIGYKPPARTFKGMVGYRKRQDLRAKLLNTLSQMFPSQVRIIQRPNQSCRRALELDNHIQVAVHLCRPTVPSLDGPRWILKANDQEKGLPCLICLTNEHLDGFAGMYVVPDFSGMIKRFKVLRNGHPLLKSGKRLDSLCEFYEATREASKGWSAQEDFLTVGDTTFIERESLLNIAGTKIKLSPVQAKMFKVLLKNADSIVSPATMFVSTIAPKPWYARTHILALRKKLGKNQQHRLVTVAREGYMYTVPTPKRHRAVPL
jgi:DNA invertase Pin-like site-specific DNA recombinase/DNA-binding winged helix-turn-helix (wHTH) protein